MGQVGANYKAKYRLPDIGVSSNIKDNFTMPVFDPSTGQNKEFVSNIIELKNFFSKANIVEIDSAIVSMYNVLADDDIILVDGISGNVDINLLPRSTAPTKMLGIMRIDTSITNIVRTVAAGTDLINNQATNQLDGQFTIINIYPATQQWIIVSSHISESQLLVPTIKQVVGSGLLTLDNDADIVDLLKVNVSDSSKFDVLGGTAQLVRNPGLGNDTYTYMTWPAQTVAVGFTDGNFPIAVEDGGTGAGTREDPAIGIIVLFDNDGASGVTPKQAVESTPLGVVAIDNNVITNINVAVLLAAARVSSKYTSDAGISVYNFSGAQGFEITVLIAALQLQISAGSAYSVGAGAIDDIEIPDEVIRAARSPAPVIALTDPVTGDFVFSGTAEVDPLLVSKSGAITAFAANGGNTAVTSTAHGIAVNDIVTITNTTNYNGKFTVVATTANIFTINTAFIADDATGNWSALTATSNSKFTNQRLFLFPQSGIVGVFYGLAEYNSIADFISQGAGMLEGFLPPAVSERSLMAGSLVIQQSIVDFSQTAAFSLIQPVQRIKA